MINMAFPTYAELRRRKGGILKGLYTELKNVAEGILPTGSVGTTELADDAVTNAKIADDAVDTDKIPIFASTEQTGTGSAQNIAHGLGVEPATVLVLFSSVGTDGATYTYTKGSTNVNVTATTGSKYFVVAIA